MIVIVLLACGLVLVTFPGVVPQPARLSGRDWSAVIAVSLATGTALVALGLLGGALSTVLPVLHSVGLADLCEAVPVPVAPGGPIVGWVAFGLGVALVVRGVRGGRRADRRARAAVVEPWLGRHEHQGDFDLVVLPTPAVLAMSVGGPSPQVVISQGLVDHLEPGALDVVVEHEATHLRCRHDRFSVLASAVEAALAPVPFVGRSASSLRDALETWADEGAGGSSRQRRALVGHAILAVDDVGPACPTAPRRSSISHRVRRFARPPSSSAPRRGAAVAPAMVLAPTAGAIAVAWQVFGHHVASLATSCPH